MATNKNDKKPKKAPPPSYYRPPPDYLAGCLPEQALCYDFITECLKAGWRVYPEYPNSRYDMLLVAEEGCSTKEVEVGTQIGVQAKMSLNPSLMGQLARSVKHLQWDGPDYVVALIPGKPRTPAEKNMEDILMATGHGLLYVYSHFEGHDSFCTRRDNLGTVGYLGMRRAFRRRIKLPDINVWSEPGVPSPVRYTPWKRNSVTFCMELAKTDGVTRKQFAAMRPRMHIQMWLDEGWVIPSGRMEGRGQIYILNPDSKDRPDRRFPEVLSELERLNEEAARKAEAEAGEQGKEPAQPSGAGGGEG